MEHHTEIGEIKIKLSLGESHKEPHLSIIDATRVIEEFDIWLEIRSDDEVQRLKKLFQVHGSNVKKFSWDNWYEYQLSAAEIIEMLNYFPKLNTLKLSSWQKEFTGDVGKLQITNIKNLEISECDNFIIDFVAKAFPENSIEELIINSVDEIDGKLCNLINKQTSIKRLNVHADLKTVEPLTHLKLDCLRCILYDRTDELENQRKFLQTLIKSQVNLTTLDLFNESDYSFSFITDEIFANICALSKLENLSVSVDSVTLNGIKSISNLTALKHLLLKIFKNDTLNVLKEFSAIKNSSLESLVLNVCYEVPTEIYEAIGQNYKNLKSLTITLEVSHRISFFAKAFPNLESLSIKYGKVNDPVEFTHVYDKNDNIKSWKLKILKLNFFGKHVVNTEAFIEFLNFFPNLNKLQIDSRLEFSAYCINKLANNLNNIKSIKLLHFDVKNEEKFDSEIISSLKHLQSKLDSTTLVLLNDQRRGSNNEEGVFYNFTYKPLLDALKYIYEIKKISYANVRVCEKLAMHAGVHETWE